MIDSHCHLDHEPLLSDLSNVIKRSKDVGIEKLLTISTSFESFSRVKELVKRDEMIFGTIGIHPHESSTNIITSEGIKTGTGDNQKLLTWEKIEETNQVSELTADEKAAYDEWKKSQSKQKIPFLKDDGTPKFFF